MGSNRIIQEVISAYEEWWRDTYIEELAEADPDEPIPQDWMSPTAGLRPLDAKDMERLEADLGELGDFRTLYEQIGVGTILAALEEEPVEYRIVAPEEMKRFHEQLDSWIQASPPGPGPEAYMPVMCDADEGFFVVAEQPLATNRLYLVDHAFAPGSAFNGPYSLEDILRGFVSASQAYEPLNPSDDIADFSHELVTTKQS